MVSILPLLFYLHNILHHVGDFKYLLPPPFPKTGDTDGKNCL